MNQIAFTFIFVVFCCLINDRMCQDLAFPTQDKNVQYQASNSTHSPPIANNQNIGSKSQNLFKWFFTAEATWSHQNAKHVVSSKIKIN